MLSHPGNHIGDSWFYITESEAHCFYLTCSQKYERHMFWDIAHAVSRDLTVWHKRGIIIQKGARGSYDEYPATGSVIRFQNKYWLAYTGNWHGPDPTVCLATSADLYHWIKYSHNPVNKADNRFYDTDNNYVNIYHWRDPFLFEREGYIYHLTTARKNQGPDEHRGAIGIARTRDMKSWEILPPAETDPVSKEMEVPQLYSLEGKYYLVFNSLSRGLTEEFSKRQTNKDRCTAYSLVSEKPFGPFRVHGDGCIIPSHHPVQPYACQIVQWQGRHYIMGTVFNEEQDFICDPIPVVFTDEGIKAKGY